MPSAPEQPMEKIIRSDGRYPPEAYAFLHEGLSKTVREIHGTEPAESGRHHVSGQELCRALRDLALERWGMLARTVLAKWNVHETVDFGNMVYLMIEHGFMKKIPEDSLEDFRDVYEFNAAFPPPGEFELKE